MLFSTIRFIGNGWIEDFYIEPDFHFSYYGFGWLPYPSPSLIYALFAGLVVFSVLIVCGLFYRLAAIGFFIVFTYIELLDKSTYLNHYYYVTLISFLLIFLPANRCFSLDVFFGMKKKSETVAAWHLGILKFQIGVVYCFAGLAKLNSDWLFNAQPLKMWLHTAHHWPLVGPLMTQDWVAYVFSWTGCLFDLSIVFFLLSRRTRIYAYGFVVIFHLLTWLLFPIGVFPWVMIVGTTIFLSENFHRKVLQGITSFWPGRSQISASLIENIRPSLKIITVSLLSVYVLFQLTFPLRGYFYPGDIFWTESGYRFSWRVMLMEKAGSAYFYLRDPETGKETEVSPGEHLTALQEKQMSSQPDMILQFAGHLQKKYADTVITTGHSTFRMRNPEVYAEVYVALNGRRSQLYVSKSRNLMAINNDLSPRIWLEEFKE